MMTLSALRTGALRHIYLIVRIGVRFGNGISPHSTDRRRISNDRADRSEEQSTNCLPSISLGGGRGKIAKGAAFVGSPPGKFEITSSPLPLSYPENLFSPLSALSSSDPNLKH